jgi:hypothetical protein
MHEVAARYAPVAVGNLRTRAAVSQGQSVFGGYPLRADYKVDARLLRRGLLDHGYGELPISSAHAVFVANLPLIHKDPFDRILVAQANVEGITLLNADSAVARYPGPIELV